MEKRSFDLIENVIEAPAPRSQTSPRTHAKQHDLKLRSRSFRPRLTWRAHKHAKRSSLQESTSRSLIGCDHEKLTFKFQAAGSTTHWRDSTRVVTGFRVILIINIMNKQTRRSFLTVCSAAGLAATLPSFYVQGSDKTGTRLPVVGSGPHTYECVHDWLVPPAGLVWGDTHGLCQDEHGHIYVGHTVHKASIRGEAIVVFDEKGRFVRAFGEGFRGGAHGLKLRREGKNEFLYHCDINRCRVVKTTLSGEVLWIHGYPREDANYMERPIDFVPTNVAFAPNGEFYVGDGYGSR